MLCRLAACCEISVLRRVQCAVFFLQMTVKENGKEPSKRRKGYYRESLHGVQKRRESLEPIQINMGEKIKFLEAAFNPERVEKSLADTQRKANPLSTGALQQMEAKLKNGATIQSEFDYKLRKLDGKLHDGTAGLAGGITKAKVDEYSSGLRETPQKSRANSQEGQNNNVNLVPVWTPEQAIRNDQTCYFCEKRVYPAERKSAENLFFHRMCFKCHHCNKILQINGDYSFDRYDPNGGKVRRHCPSFEIPYTCIFRCRNLRLISFWCKSLCRQITDHGIFLHFYLVVVLLPEPFQESEA